MRSCIISRESGEIALTKVVSYLGRYFSPLDVLRRFLSYNVQKIRDGIISDPCFEAALPRRTASIVLQLLGLLFCGNTCDLPMDLRFDMPSQNVRGDYSISFAYSSSLSFLLMRIAVTASRLAIRAMRRSNTCTLVLRIWKCIISPESRVRPRRKFTSLAAGPS